jgi:hypothetical protein
MARIGGNRSRSVELARGLTARERYEANKGERRARQAMIEDEILRRRKFDDEHPCPICKEACRGFLSRNGKSARCRRVPSQNSERYTPGYWHRLWLKECSCGEAHL